MRYLAILITVSALFIFGCSGGSKLPTQPENPQLPSNELTSNQTGLLYEGSFDIDIETKSITQTPDRQTDYVYDITGFLPDKCPGGCFRFVIVGVVGTVLEIELTLENPLTIQVYDVRIMYLDLFGKTVLNTDSFTDFLGTPITETYPFTAFTNDDPDRAFPVGPGGIDTQTIFLDFPPGSASSVNYAITASLPGQTEEPYEIGDMMQTGILTPSGGNATISCIVDDHQADISGVYMDATPFTGAPVQLLPDPLSPGYFAVDISNTSLAPVGSYNQLIMALSPNPQNISTYNYVEITVTAGQQEDPIAIIDTIPDPPIISVTSSIITFDGSRSYDPDGGPITLYEWDLEWDADPANFEPDIVGTQAIIEHDYSCAVGIHIAGLRVTDDDTPAGISEIAQVTIELVDDFVPGNWDISRMLGEEKIQGDFLYVTSQSLQVDSDGWTHIVTYNSENIFHRTYQDGSMSDIDTFSDTSGYIRMVTSAIDNNDVLHIVWLTGWTAPALHHTTYENGVFTGIVEVLYTETRPDYRLEMMNIQRNHDGHIMLTLLSHDVDMTDVFFMYTINTGSGFSPPTNIPHQIHIRSSSDPSPGYTNVAPNLVSTPDGHFHQIYYAKEADLVFNIIVFDLVYDGASWAPPRVAYDYPSSGQTIYDISACAASDGDIYLVGQHEAGHAMHYIRYDSFTDTWLDDMKVATDCDSGFSFGAIEADELNMVHFAYTGFDGYIRMKVFCECSDEATILAIPSETIDTTTIANEHNHIDLMWDLDGNLSAVYQDTRSSPIHTYFNQLIYN